MQRHQRRRTRRIHRHRRALQTQHIRHPTRRHTQRRTAQTVPLEVAGYPALAAVGAVKYAGVHAGRRAAQRGRVNPGAFQGFPGHLQQQPLLRIHRQRLARRYPEELGIETGDVGKESAAAGVRGAHRVGVRVKQIRQVPAAIARKVRHHVTAGGHHLPQAFGVVDTARIAAAHSHHGHRLRRLGQKVTVFALQPLVFLECFAQGRDELFSGAVHATRSFVLLRESARPARRLRNPPTEQTVHVD
ncbi:hypothetical protein LAUMK13_02462 [Mycobacterium innocens]|uniref:Uncharacterized protein n=1 Tax=Mycobacterium innocens TaxID=2341083 RepID=A0A498Q2P4_9MYCO|nr:hypothetical protein LAUMK13_02462 [Mycobacterium innocens]